MTPQSETAKSILSQISDRDKRNLHSQTERIYLSAAEAVAKQIVFDSIPFLPQLSADGNYTIDQLASAVHESLLTQDVIISLEHAEDIGVLGSGMILGVTCAQGREEQARIWTPLTADDDGTPRIDISYVVSIVQE